MDYEKNIFMKTIKSFTSLEQSEVLVKILPLESADMKWYFWKDEIDAPKLPTFGYSKDAAENYKSTETVYLPCWSLAALIGVIPNPSLHKTFSGWRCDSYNEEGTSCILGEPSDNPVDACVAMIEKLHKLNFCNYGPQRRVQENL